MVILGENFKLNRHGHKINLFKITICLPHIFFYLSTHPASGVCYKLTVNHLSDSYLIVKTSMDCWMKKCEPAPLKEHVPAHIKLWSENLMAEKTSWLIFLLFFVSCKSGEWRTETNCCVENWQPCKSRAVAEIYFSQQQRCRLCGAREIHYAHLWSTFSFGDLSTGALPPLCAVGPTAVCWVSRQ